MQNKRLFHAHHALLRSSDAFLKKSRFADARRTNNQPGLARLHGRQQGFHLIPASEHGNQLKWFLPRQVFSPLGSSEHRRLPASPFPSFARQPESAARYSPACPPQ